MLIRRLTPKDTDCFQALRLQALREDASAFAGEELVGMIGVSTRPPRRCTPPWDLRLSAASRILCWLTV